MSTKNWIKLRVGCLVLMSLSASAQASIPIVQKMKCPIGGKKFEFVTTAAMSNYGTRPDGKEFTNWESPMPLPVCPDNGLVVYGNFTDAAELKKMKALVASPEYQAMRRTETTYYMAQWLLKRFDAPTENVLWYLLQAIWQTDGDPALKEKYQREYLELAAHFPRPEKPANDINWIVLQGRGVDLLRQLGRFDEAEKLIGTLSDDSLNVPIPEEQVVGTTASGYGKKIGNYAEIQEAKARRNWISFFERLRAVIVRKDASLEPIDMLPTRVQAEKCMTKYDAADPIYAAVCTSEPVVKRIEVMKRSRELLTPSPK